MTTISQQLTELSNQQQDLETRLNLCLQTQTEILQTLKQINEKINTLQQSSATTSAITTKITVRRPKVVSELEKNKEKQNG